MQKAHRLIWTGNSRMNRQGGCEYALFIVPIDLHGRTSHIFRGRKLSDCLLFTVHNRSLCKGA
eukprot:1354580-Pleurochrysis_carterae.AAC.1